MSILKLKGNDSGTGTVTLEAPNTNTDQTISIPDGAGSFVTANASGDVGIGTSSPDGRADIAQDQNTTKFTSPHLALTATGTTDTTGFTGISYATSTLTNYGWTVGALRATSGVNSAFLFTQHNNSASGTERMRIDSSGNIKISGDDKQIYWGAGTTAIDGSSSNNRIRFYTSNTERLLLLPAGALYIGEANPITSGDGLRIGLNSGSSGNYIRFKWAGAEYGSVTLNGGGISYNTSSDYRLKENVTDLTGASDRVNQIPVHRFNFIADPDTTVDGFLAHEVADIVPEAITGTKDAMRDEEYEVTPAVLDDDGNVVTEAVMGTRSVPDYQGIDQSKLVPLLTAALQEALAKIETLETEMTSVKARLDALEAV